jgi:Undecaprenyl-phosphate glucose phosphotransferase
LNFSGQSCFSKAQETGGFNYSRKISGGRRSIERQHIMFNNVENMEIEGTERTASKSAGRYAFAVKVIPGIQTAIDSGLLLVIGLASYFSLVYYSYKTADIYYYTICFNWLVTVLLMHFGGLYRFDAILNPVKSIDRIILACVTTLLMILASGFSLKISGQISRLWICTLFVSSTAGFISARFLCSWAIWKLSISQVIVRRVAVYGEKRQVEQFVTFAGQMNHQVFSIEALFLEPGQALSSSRYRVHHGFNELKKLIRSDAIDDVVLAMPWSESRKIRDLVEQLRELPTNVLLAADLAGYELPMTPPPSCYESTPMYQLVGKPQSGGDRMVKALIDFAVAGFLLVVLSPLLALVAVLIRLGSPGPVIFKQQRLGFNNRPFSIYKFRTMIHEAPSESTTVQAISGDSRVTRLGRFLRKSSIDELPQLINVLNGSMSLVGPRPHAIDHNEDYSRRIRGYFARHKAKPGITGLAQIKGFRGPTETDEKMERRVRYDIEYIEKWSPFLDLKILALTPFAVIFAKNAV